MALTLINKSNPCFLKILFNSLKPYPNSFIAGGFISTITAFKLGFDKGILPPSKPPIQTLLHLF
jgi:hypothetical protein